MMIIFAMMIHLLVVRKGRFRRSVVPSAQTFVRCFTCQKQVCRFRASKVCNSHRLFDFDTYSTRPLFRLRRSQWCSFLPALPDLPRPSTCHLFWNRGLHQHGLIGSAGYVSVCLYRQRQAPDISRRESVYHEKC